jgi:hypothetical protein
MDRHRRVLEWYRRIPYKFALGVLDDAVTSLGSTSWEHAHRVVVLLAR